ncbi:MAG: DUF2333 family protein [Alphaproteobacteria bacterium]|jgi:hypothetical protein
MRQALGRVSRLPVQAMQKLGRTWIGRNPWIRWPALAFVVFVLFYYPIGMALFYVVDDDLSTEPTVEVFPSGSSKAVATAITLIERESDRWAPNKPFWHPASALSYMPNFQTGMMYAISRFAVELGDQLGRTRGSSAIDTDLDKAAGLLKTEPTRWFLSGGSILMSKPSHHLYQDGAQALRDYNNRLADGNAVYDQRADNLIKLLDRIASDLGASSAALDKRTLESNAGYFDTQADDLFMNIKGRVYGYYMLLRDVGTDFQSIIGDKQAAGVWAQMMGSLRVAADMFPFVVANGAQDGFLVPSHLSAQGFYLLRARTQMREVSDALAK